MPVSDSISISPVCVGDDAGATMNPGCMGKGLLELFSCVTLKRLALITHPAAAVNRAQRANMRVRRVIARGRRLVVRA